MRDPISHGVVTEFCDIVEVRADLTRLFADYRATERRPFDVSPWIPNILYLITNLFVKGESVLILNRMKMSQLTLTSLGSFSRRHSLISNGCSNFERFQIMEMARRWRFCLAFSERLFLRYQRAEACTHYFN